MATRDLTIDIAVDDQHIAGTLVAPATVIPGVLFGTSRPADQADHSGEPAAA